MPPLCPDFQKFIWKCGGTFYSRTVTIRAFRAQYCTLFPSGNSARRFSQTLIQQLSTPTASQTLPGSTCPAIEV